MEENQSHQESNNYELKREQKLLEQNKLQARRKAKKMTKTILISVAAIGAIGGLIWYGATRPPLPENAIISRTGLHWHSELSIEINGQKQDISAEIGLGVVHNPVHTHDTTGTIHLEFSGLVKKDDLKSGQFFKIWGKQFNTNCVFDFCSSDGKTVKMFVNGKENMEFENYEMKDKDKIEIKYE